MSETLISAWNWRDKFRMYLFWVNVYEIKLNKHTVIVRYGEEGVRGMCVVR